MNNDLIAKRRAIGKNIARLRRKARMTQADLARELNQRAGTNYKGSAISAWEHATNAIHSDYMPYLAEIFEVSLSRIFGQPEDEDTLRDQYLLDLTDEERDAVDHYIAFLLYRRNH